MDTISRSTSLWHGSICNTYFNVYNIIVTKRKHRIFPNDISTFYKELEFLSTSNEELDNIYESSHEEEITTFIKIRT